MRGFSLLADARESGDKCRNCVVSQEMVANPRTAFLHIVRNLLGNTSEYCCDIQQLSVWPRIGALKS